VWVRFLELLRLFWGFTFSLIKEKPLWV
jgi:hypothetical protein